jgi:hypothetical protein
MVNYYRHTRAKDGLAGAPERGLALAWLPCLLSAGTTGLGLISLYTSELVPIKTFGLYSSLGVMAMVGLMYLYLPSALALWAPSLPREPGEVDGNWTGLTASHRRRMNWLGRKIIARPWAVWTGFLAIAMICGSGLYWAKTTVNLMSLFSPDTPIIHSYSWLEEKLGPMVPMEVVVRIDPRQTNLTFLERMEFVQRIQQNVAKLPKVGGVMSAATFANLEPPAKRGLKGVLMNPQTYRSVLNRRLEAHREDFLGDYLAEDKRTGEELWRVSLRVAALANIDYGAFLKDIGQQVEPVIGQARNEGVAGIAGVIYTGLTPVVYRAERVLLGIEAARSAGLTEEWVRALNQGGPAIAEMLAQADKAGQKFDMLKNKIEALSEVGNMTKEALKSGLGTVWEEILAFWLRDLARLNSALLAFANTFPNLAAKIFDVDKLRAEGETYKELLDKMNREAIPLPRARPRAMKARSAVPRRD